MSDGDENTDGSWIVISSVDAETGTSIDGGDDDDDDDDDDSRFFTTTLEEDLEKCRTQWTAEEIRTSIIAVDMGNPGVSRTQAELNADKYIALHVPDGKGGGSSSSDKNKKTEQKKKNKQKTSGSGKSVNAVVKSSDSNAKSCGSSDSTSTCGNSNGNSNGTNDNDDGKDDYDHHTPFQAVGGNAHPMHQCRNMLKYLTQQWSHSHYVDRVTAVWKGMGRDTRRRLIRCYAAYFPRWPGDKNGGTRLGDTSGVSVLLPEMNIKDLCDDDDGAGLLRLMNMYACVPLTQEERDEANNDEGDDCDEWWRRTSMILRACILHCRALIMSNVMPGRDSGEFVMYPYQPSKLQDYNVPQRGGPDTQQQIQRYYIDMDIACERPVYELALMRLDKILGLFIAVLDEMKTSLWGAEVPKMLRMTGCWASGCKRGESAIGKALKLCSRCKIAAYCSSDCQRAHWRVHKATCGK